jgi:kynurenine formamidase
MVTNCHHLSPLFTTTLQCGNEKMLTTYSQCGSEPHVRAAGVALPPTLREQPGTHYPGDWKCSTKTIWCRRKLIQARGLGFRTVDDGHDWLSQNKWGLENTAGLGQLQAKGSTIIVGGPKIAGCTGGPGRVLALLK